MGIIRQLSPQMANMIAAGEVVERPASVVKEIIENAVDAGASHIEVEIKNGGITYIRISDNGRGMTPDDVPQAFLRHATSKVYQPADLVAIGTLGFRGEALAAISAVSKVDIFTRTENSISGTHMTCEGGEAGEPQETGCPLGTTITVRDLFYNVPARMKFLKKDATEAAYCENVVQSAALANPRISFRFVKDGREVFFTLGKGNLRQIISAIYGNETARSLLEVQGNFPGAEISGLISPKSVTRSSRSMQYFIVNGRPVKGKFLSAAIDACYKGRIMPGRHPICFLNIKVNPSMVDVNVHPAKLEVKFSNEKAVFSAIHSALKLILDMDDRRPDMFLPEEEEKTEETVVSQEKTEQEEPVSDDFGGLRITRAPDGELTAPESTDTKFLLASPTAEAAALASEPAAVGGMTHAPETKPFDIDESMFQMDSRQLVPPRKGPSAFGRSAGGNSRHSHSVQPSAEIVDALMELARYIPPEPPAKAHMTAQDSGAAPMPVLIPEAPPVIEVVGMVFDTYIVVQENDVLWLIDKHAAHEKLIFNELKARIDGQDTQLLMMPVTIDLTPAEKQACLDNRALLEKCGFEIDDLGLSGLTVRGAPVYLQESDIAFVLSEMAEKLLAGFDTESSILNDLLASIACKAAIKGGSYSDKIELQRLAEQVLCLPDVRNCPHGRPVAVNVTKRQLEKQFKRV